MIFTPFANPVQFSSIQFGCKFGMRDITYTNATESHAASEVREAQIIQYNAVNWELTNLQLNKVCKHSCHLQTLQLFPRTEKRWLSCHLQTLQLFPRSRKTMMFLPLTNPTAVPTQQKSDDLPATYKPYSCSHAQKNLQLNKVCKSFPWGAWSAD